MVYRKCKKQRYRTDAGCRTQRFYGFDANVRLASSDNANLNMVPSLIISYRDSKGLEDYWTYETVDFAGIGTRVCQMCSTGISHSCIYTKRRETFYRSM